MTNTEDEDVQHVLELRRIKRQVLKELERQAARFAGQVPTYITIELEQTRQDLQLLDARLQIVPHSPETLEAIGGDALALKVDIRLKEIEQKFLAAVNNVSRTQIEMSASSEQWRKDEGEHRAQRQQEHDKRMTANEEQIGVVLDIVGRLGERLDGVLWLVGAIVVIGAIVTVLIVWRLAQ